MNKLIINLVVFLFCVNILVSQEGCMSQEKSNFKGQIIGKDGNKIESDDISLKNDIVTFKNGRNRMDTISIEKINLIRAVTGNYAVEGALLGGLGGLVLILTFDLNIVDNTISDDAYLVGTGLGMGIGLIIGLLTSRNETIYRCGRLQISTLNPPNTKYLQNISLSSNILNIKYIF